MIDTHKLIDIITSALEVTDYYLVDASVKGDNVITVEIDADEGVDIDFCADLSRKIEAAFDRDVEDYELEVGSAGITSPLKVARQYQRQVGKEVEVLARDGKKHRGILKSYDDLSGIVTITEKQKVKLPDKKRPEIQEVEIEFTPEERNAVLPVLDF